MNNLENFLIIGQEDWDEVWRRNQFIIAGLAKRFPQTKFLFVELAFDFTTGIRSGQLFKKNSKNRKKLEQLFQGLRSLKDYPNIFLLTGPKIFPNKIRWGAMINNYLQIWCIEKAMKKLSIVKPLIWTQNPFAATIVINLKKKAIVYDITDDWTVLNGASKEFLKQAVEGDNKLTEQADLIIACSDYLYEKKISKNNNTVLIQNGVNVAHYSRIGNSDLSKAASIKVLPKPIFGYTGSLHEARLDLELIKSLAKARPDLSLVFIGPNFLSKEYQKQLENFKNIYLLGSVSYDKLPSYMQGFDGLMIPHRISSFTESLNPIKLFEYLAAGLPVVSTKVAGVRDYGEVIHLAENNSQFVELVNKVLSPSYIKNNIQARKLAYQASWENRINDVLQSIDTLLNI